MESATLLKVFGEWLPWLLQNPNADDPLNKEAAFMYRADLEKFKRKAKRYSGDV